MLIFQEKHLLYMFPFINKIYQYSAENQQPGNLQTHQIKDRTILITVINSLCMKVLFKLNSDITMQILLSWNIFQFSLSLIHSTFHLLNSFD